MRRYTYGFCSGKSSVGMNPANFESQKMTSEMNDIALVLHNMLKLNKKFLNLENVDLEKKCNHYSVVLYYTGDNLKPRSLLGMHSD